MKRNCQLLLTVALLLAAGIVAAQDRLLKEIYVKVGVNSTRTTESSDDTLIAGSSFEYDFEEADSTGYELGVGATVFNFLRTEVSYGQNSSSYDLGFGPSGYPVVPAETDIDSTLIMVDFNWELASLGITPEWLRPYVGFGIGYAWHDMEDIDISTSTFDTEGGENSDLTWRFTIGVGLKLSANLVIDVSYSWIDAGVAESGTAFPGAPTPLSEPIEVEMTSERISAGLRFMF